MNVLSERKANDILKVYYPLGGRTFLLHWYTNHDRGHVVLSRTEKGLRATADRVFEENPDAEIKDLLEIDVVGPSKKLIKRAEKAAADTAIREFYEEVTYRLIEAVKAGHKLPAPFEPCSKYEPDEEDEIELNDWAIESHYMCRHCKSGIKLVAATPSALYERYHGPWAAKHPRPQHEPRGRVPSRAEPWDDKPILWYASADFGHHAKGVTLNEVNLEDDFMPGYFSDRLMFFFVHIRALDPQPFRDRLEEHAEMAEIRQAQREEARRIEFEKEKEDQNNDILALFTEINT